MYLKKISYVPKESSVLLIVFQIIITVVFVIVLFYLVRIFRNHKSNY